MTRGNKAVPFPRSPIPVIDTCWEWTVLRSFPVETPHRSLTSHICCFPIREVAGLIFQNALGSFSLCTTMAHRLHFFVAYVRKITAVWRRFSRNHRRARIARYRTCISRVRWRCSFSVPVIELSPGTRRGAGRCCLALAATASSRDARKYIPLCATEITMTEITMIGGVGTAVHNLENW